MISKLKSLFLSWDTIGALVLAVLLAILTPGAITYAMAKEVYAASMSVLAVIFSVFFAGLAVLITAGDDEFVCFLQEDGSYARILWTFKFTLTALFVSLLASIGLFVHALTYGSRDNYPEWLLMVFALLAFYSLFAAVGSSLHAIKYAEVRARFLETDDNAA